MAKGALKGISATVAYLLLFAVFAIVYLIVMLYAIKFATGFLEITLDHNTALLSASILTAATLLGGGAIGFFEE